MRGEMTKAEGGQEAPCSPRPTPRANTYMDTAPTCDVVLSPNAHLFDFSEEMTPLSTQRQ